MQNIYEKYMKKCIALAKRGEGFVSPNPLVGAVVLDKQGKEAEEKRLSQPRKFFPNKNK